MTASRRAAWRGGDGPAAELRALLRLGLPLIAAQLATVALQTTDVIMLGWVGPGALAGGALGFALLFPFVMFASGVALASAPMIAQALGARRRREARRSLRAGLWATALLSAVLVPLLAQGEALLLAIGQAPGPAAGAGDYLAGAVWHVPFVLAFATLRGYAAARGGTGFVMAVALGGVAVNALADYALIFGGLGAPRLGLFGAGLATTLTHAAMAAALAAHLARRWRRDALFVRIWRIDPARLGAVFAMGTPIGLTLIAETGLFSAAAMLIGYLGADALAGHAAALQLASAAFMVPLGLSQATTARVGLAWGAGDRAAAALSAWTSLGVSLAVMGAAALAFLLAPGPLVGLFIDPAAPGSARPFALAVGYLGVAALFQLVDGAQVSALGALRGMGDVRAPMVIAIGGYWALGFPAAWLTAFPLGLEGRGVWLGLAVGLGCAAVMLIARLAAKLRG